MSDYEYRQARKIIYTYYEKYGRGLEYEECMDVSWLAYVEVRQQLANIYNTEILWEMARNRIRDELSKLRKIRNEKIRVCSNLSLNQTVGDSKEPVYTYYFPVHGDFVNGLCLWDYIKHLGGPKEKIINMLYRGDDSLDIMDDLKMEELVYYKYIEEIRKDFIKYEEDQWE